MKVFKILAITLLGCVATGVMESSAKTPLIEEGKEWGYFGHRGNPTSRFGEEQTCCFYRLRFKGVQEIEGKQYNKLYLSTSLNFDEGRICAYMREEEDKVFVRYPAQEMDEINIQLTGLHNPEWNYFQNRIGEDLPTCTDEFLLYDFGVQQGGSMTISGGSADNGKIMMKCIETGTIETESGQREFLKFKADSNLPFLTYEYLLEGVGPLGNSDLFFPYRWNQSTGTPSSTSDLDLLYVRETVEQGNGSVVPGSILYRAPQFEVFGIHDPTIWFLHGTDTEPVSESVPDLQIGYAYSPNILVSLGEDITEVQIFDSMGRKVSEIRPDSRIVEIGRDDCADNDYVVIRATGTRGSRSFKQNWK